MGHRGVAQVRRPVHRERREFAIREGDGDEFTPRQCQIVHERRECSSVGVGRRVDVVRGPPAQVHGGRTPRLGLGDFRLERVTARRERAALLEQRVPIVSYVFRECVARRLARGSLAMMRTGEVQFARGSGPSPVAGGAGEGARGRVGDGDGGDARRDGAVESNARRRRRTFVARAPVTGEVDPAEEEAERGAGERCAELPPHGASASPHVVEQRPRSPSHSGTPRAVFPRVIGSNNNNIASC